MEAKRKRVNGMGHKALATLPSRDVLRVDITHETAGFYRQDGVHLSDVGSDFLLDAMKDAIAAGL